MKTKGRTLLSVVVLVSLLLCVSPARSAVAEQGPIDRQDLQTFLDGVINAQLQKYNIPGAAVSVVKDSQLFFAKGYGYADLAQHKPVAADQTLLGPGSIAKLFTWTAVMQLVEQDKLDLNANVNLYLTDFQIPATYPNPITLAHLMTHSAGFDDPFNFYTHHAGELVPLAEFVTHHLPAHVRPPGELSTYSNYGAALAGTIVEQVSGQPFEQYIEEHILKPLDMQHTTIRQPIPASMVDDLAIGYRYADGDYRIEPFVYIQISPAGSLLTTATDMAHFMIAQLEDGQFEGARILRTSTARLMQQQLFTNDPQVSGWAYGYMEMRLNDQRLLWHQGDTPLFHSLLVLWPDHHLGLFVTYNGDGGSQAIMPLLQAFLDHYFPVSIPAPIEPATGPSQRLDRYTGSYRLIPRASTTFEKAKTFVQNQVDVSLDPNGTLLLTGLGDPALLMEVAPRVFRLPLIAGQPNWVGNVVFCADDTGRTTHFLLANEPLAVYEKISWYQTAAFNFGLLGVCVVLFASALLRLIALPRGRQQSNEPRFADQLICFISALNLIFLIGILIILSRPYVTTGEIAPFLMPLLSIALVSAALTAGALVFALLAWTSPYWNLVARIHYTWVALAATTFVWWLNEWNLLGFRL